jgi:glycosyltransferase involved in cell wall biosynthesis
VGVRISAVICTRNREAYLRKALRSLTDQTLAQELYEIIVVNNGSEDNTKEVVFEFSDVPNLRYLYEPVIGVSRARNTAWRKARGSYVAFLDDDAVACRTWLEKYIEMFETFKPSPGSVGGKCEAIWEAPQPHWLSVKMLGYLSIIDWSDVPIILNKEQWLSVCNMAVRRELLEAAGGFREDLDRQGNKLRTGGETYLLQRLDSWGHCSVYHPEIVVGHHVPRSRLTKSWFRQRAYWQGLSDAIMLHKNGQRSCGLGARLALIRIALSLLRSFPMVVGSNAAARFRRQCQLVEAMGYIVGLCAS